jgi:hypothetical protein
LSFPKYQRFDQGKDIDKNANEKPPAPKIGELLVKEGLVKKEDIESTLEIQRKETKESELPLGMLLVKNGLITKIQLQRLLDHPYLRKHIGKLAVEKGLVNEKQLEDCIKKKRPNELIGQVLIKEGYAKADDIKGLLNQQIAGSKLGQKVMSNLNIAERRLPQNGAFRITYVDKEKNRKSIST